MINPWWWNLHIYSWKDIIELLTVCITVYYFSLWLKQDFQKPLLFTFYGYCITLFGTHYLELFTLSSTLVWFAPAFAVAFIVLHQETLQRNFVMLHNITPSVQDAEQWVDVLMRSALVAVSNNKEFQCIIEKRDSLATVLTYPVRLNCPLTENLLNTLIESNSFDSELLITLSSDGTLKGINGAWKKSSIDTWLAREVKEQEEWLQDALFFTSKTDALFFRINPQTRTTTVVAQGKVLDQISAHSALRTIKQYLGLSSPYKKGEPYVAHQEATTSKQSQS